MQNPLLNNINKINRLTIGQLVSTIAIDNAHRVPQRALDCVPGLGICNSGVTDFDHKSVTFDSGYNSDFLEVKGTWYLLRLSEPGTIIKPFGKYMSFLSYQICPYQLYGVHHACIRKNINLISTISVTIISRSCHKIESKTIYFM